MEFQEPIPEGTVSGEVTINFSTNDSEDYSISLDYSGTTKDVTTLTANGSYTDYTLEEDDYATSGEMTIEVSRDQGNGSDFVNVIADNEEPQVENLNLDDRVNSEFGPIEFEVTDRSEITNLDVEIDNGDALDENFDCGEESCSGEFEIDFPDDELSHGNSYDLDIVVKDEYGNELSDTWDFTYDNKYEGDSDPDVVPEPGVFRGGGPDELFVSLDGEDEDSDIRVGCRPSSWFESDWTEFEYLDDDEKVEFRCDSKPVGFDYGHDFSVKLQDEAGNTETVDVGRYLFDQTRPTIGNLSAIVGVFNGDFKVDYDYYDTPEVDGLDVAKIHYQVDDSDLDLEAGSNVSEVDGDFMVDTEGLESGDHTVYAWAVDRAGRVSEVSSFEFDFRPNAEPSASIGVEDSLSVTAGDSRVVSANVTNTAELFIGGMDLQLFSDLHNASRSLDGLKPGASEESMFSVDTEASDLGVHVLELSTESPDASKSVRLTVEANKEQEQEIEAKYSEYLEKYESLDENVSSLKSQVSGDREKKLDSNTSEFFSDFEAAKAAKESGDLYRVESKLENISQDFSTASNTYEEIKKKHQTSERNQTIGLFLLFFVTLGGGGVAYVAFFSEEYYLDLEALKEEFEVFEEPIEAVQQTASQYELSLEPLENAVAKVGELLAEEEKEIEEAEEQAFQGFT